MKKFEITLTASEDFIGQKFTLNLANNKIKQAFKQAEKLEIIASYLKILEIDSTNQTLVIATLVDNEDEDTITELLRQFLNEDLLNPLVTITVLALEFEDPDPTVKSAAVV